jgi:signal recognition particle subunit SRP54
MFEQISAKLQDVFKKLRGEARLTPDHVDAALKELRMALLEADVHFRVAKDFCGEVRQKAVGGEILSSLTASQQVIKILHDEMVSLLGGTGAELEFGKSWPAVIVMAGLSGSGKTTTTVKLGRWLAAGRKHPAVVSVDVKRPAAIEQLHVLAKQAGLACLEPQKMEPVGRARDAVGIARDSGFDVLLVDTAGRIHLDPELMEELRQVVDATEPEEILFVADSMTGQDAVRSAEAFAEVVPVTGHILTKLDGDARGGAALSITAATGKPIKFVGVGEKLDAFEPFYPDRMASRILGMGDVLTLIERAGEVVEQDKAEELARKIRREELTLEDFREQLKQIRRMGSLGELMSLIPGASQLPTNVDETELVRFQAILNSMTLEERQVSSLINGSRRRRIAQGSGNSVADVNRLLKRFAEARKMIKTLARSRGKMGKNLGKLMGRMR